MKSVNPKTNLELLSWRMAVRSLLANSNATVIRNYTDKGYGCGYCSEQFRDPAELKKHSHETHKAETFMGDRVQARFFVKMDVTNLQCNLCEETFPTIEQIITHINESHHKNILPDIKKLIMPFKFERNELRCCECSKIFNAFQALQNHMHSHYSNYICDVCSAGFITPKSLHNHKKSLHLAESVKCNCCTKVFISREKARQHELKVHKKDKRYLMSMCRLCNERFKTYDLKKKHLKEAHGVSVGAVVDPEKFKCLACDKCFSKKVSLHYHTERFHMMLKEHKCTECDEEFYTLPDLEGHMVKHSSDRKYSCETCPNIRFKTAKALSMHVKRHHLMERPHACPECDMKFFRPGELKAHMPKHTGLREFKCEVCQKAFGRQKTLAEHRRKRPGFSEIATETKAKFEEVTVKVEIEEEVDVPVEMERVHQKTNLKLMSWRIAVRRLLASSNATTIRKHNDNGYGCSYCQEQFRDPAELKKHTLETHKTETFTGDKDQAQFFVKMDITNLKCNFCEETFDTIDQIITHLNESHHKNILPHIKNLIMPFKFEDNELRCCECSQIFNVFQALQHHMHSHYRNHVCDICFAGKRPEFCEIATDTKVKIEEVTVKMEIDEEFDVPEEMKSVHQKTNIELLSWRIAARRLLAGSNATVIRNHNDKGYGCGFCREQFPDPAELKKHSHEKHKPETFIGDKVQARFFLKLDITNLKCNLCEEKFTTSDQIITHLNESHRKRPEFSEIATETKVKLEEVIVKMEIDDEVDVTAEVKNVNQKTNLELLSWRIAVRSLLASSNATVIRNYTDKGYGCGFCPEQFRDPSELKNTATKT
ncbi:PR domain zinc finger protein 5-like isoform X13 [Phthorimaea operculella]|nr:PR domain zinc finger protein 5-like isoform X13 [Phthorimaea operculella]